MNVKRPIKASFLKTNNFSFFFFNSNRKKNRKLGIKIKVVYFTDNAMPINIPQVIECLYEVDESPGISFKER